MLRAVICDDDQVARRVMSSMVVARGFDVIGEVDLAIDAIRLVEALEPELLVLDVSMPGMSGLEALDTLRRLCPDTRVVVVTAFDLAAGSDQLEGAFALVDKANLERLDEVLDAAANDVASRASGEG